VHSFSNKFKILPKLEKYFIILKFISLSFYKSLVRSRTIQRKDRSFISLLGGSVLYSICLVINACLLAVTLRLPDHMEKQERKKDEEKTKGRGGMGFNGGKPKMEAMPTTSVASFEEPVNQQSASSTIC
jgi:hypothetical protein